MMRFTRIILDGHQKLFAIQTSNSTHVDLCCRHGHADSEPDDAPGRQDHVDDLVEGGGSKGHVPTYARFVWLNSVS